MKKLLIGTMMLVSAASFAQDALSKFFDKYQNDDAFTQVKVSQKMFGLFTNLSADDPNDKEVLDAISKIQGLRILAKHETRDSRALYQEAMVDVPKDFEELMSVRDKDKDVKFYIKQLASGKVSDLVMIMGGSSEFMVLNLFGEIDLKKISSIGKKMNIDGFENLQKFKNKRKNKNDKND